MKSTLEGFLEKTIKKGITCSDEEVEEMFLIIKLLRSDKELNDQIMSDAAKTIKTIQPSILLGDFEIAMTMAYSIVANAIYYLKKNGYIEIKKGGEIIENRNKRDAESK